MVLDVSTIIDNKIKQLEADGVIQKAIEDGLEKAILKAIEDEITGYGTEKLIRKQVEECISETCADIGLTAYNGLIANAVSQIIHGTVAEDLQNRIEEEVTGLLLRKNKPVKLSDILDQYREYIRDGDYHDPEEKFCIICERLEKHGIFERDLAYVVAFDENGDRLDAERDYAGRIKNKGDFDIFFETFSVQKEKASIWKLYFNGEPAENMLQRRALSRFECFLLNIYLNKITILLDDVDTDDCYYNEDEY